MRLPIIALAGVLSLAACNTTGGGSVGDRTAALIAQAQSIAQQVCGFLPVAESLAQIVAQGRPELATASQIGNAVCSAVTKKTARRGGGAPTVAGVPVQGQFVR